MDKQVKFKKIPTKLLIETLVHLYDLGAEFIDITGMEDNVQDVITISVEPDYMSDGENIPDDVNFINDKLSDDDINDLLQ